MDYINDQNGLFKLDPKNIHSILMSSDYLDMPNLLNLCIEYFIENIELLLKQKEPMPTYKSHLAKSIARKFCEKQLHACKFVLVMAF